MAPMATRRAIWRPTVQVTHADGLVVLTVFGRLGEAGAAAQPLRAAVSEGLAAGRGLVVDLSGVDYLSSPGITLLEDLVEQARVVRRPVAFCGVTHATRIALDLADLTGTLPCAETRDEAVRMIEEGG
jgi:anti-anti-sigma factor